MSHEGVKFLIIGHGRHKIYNDDYYGYAPYIREMNIWLRYVDEVRIVAPLVSEPLSSLEMAYAHPNLSFVDVPLLDFQSFWKGVESLFRLPEILFSIFKAMRWSNHIHLRCPGNMGLLGAILQICFPQKRKTVKYANNWDRSSRQPLTYRLQQYILKNEFLTRNTKLLVYGDWGEKSRNVVPFFTASYGEAKAMPVLPRNIEEDESVKLIFVGTLTPNKRPLITIKVLQELLRQNISAHLTMIGGGNQEEELREYVVENNLDEFVRFTGKMFPDQVELCYRNSHFLVFLSETEGWPKVVAEAMWWGCVPVVTNVSCVKQMLGGNTRGVLVLPDFKEAANAIVFLIKHPNQYSKKANLAMQWARQYNLERFERSIVHFIN
ncbi:glycosyltransferase family 4 protein [Marinilabilia rubra]|uniref:Glycosyl transferase n=1 Tax=Marinilabilia rubra TaxID=2162893 RepID=A0A2U2B4M5_9BACT|nr:glycosyltransferase [Marinilabilia rubra]PWD98012.1 glycosyl transferase [Marinilabilia rubra]